MNRRTLVAAVEMRRANARVPNVSYGVQSGTQVQPIATHTTRSGTVGKRSSLARYPRAAHVRSGVCLSTVTDQQPAAVLRAAVRLCARAQRRTFVWGVARCDRSWLCNPADLAAFLYHRLTRDFGGPGFPNRVHRRHTRGPGRQQVFYLSAGCCPAPPTRCTGVGSCPIYRLCPCPRDPR
jgi:hypothetical protein